MPKPTKTALAKHPLAVVLLAAPVTDPSKADHDFEWFDTKNGRKLFTDQAIEWASKDADDNGDLIHLIAVLDNTTPPLKIAQLVTVRNADNPDAVEGAKQLEAMIKADPDKLISPSNRTAPADGAVKKAAPKVKPKVKGRKPTAAAAVLNNGEAEKAAGKADELKKKLAAKKTPAKKAEPDDAPVNTWAMPVGRRAGLMRKR